MHDQELKKRVAPLTKSCVHASPALQADTVSVTVRIMYPCVDSILNIWKVYRKSIVQIIMTSGKAILIFFLGRLPATKIALPDVIII